VAIETVLDQGLPDAYTPELYEQKAAALFQHVYGSYYGAAKSVYEQAA
jgi:type I restriction enzyme R subunit